MTQTCWCMNMNQSKIFGFGYLLENGSTLEGRCTSGLIPTCMQGAGQP
jgi:hypothetical protein